MLRAPCAKPEAWPPAHVPWLSVRAPRRTTRRARACTHQPQLLLFVKLQRANSLEQVCAASIAQRGAQLVHLLGDLGERGGDLSARGVVSHHVTVREQGVESAARTGPALGVRSVATAGQAARTVGSLETCQRGAAAQQTGTTAGRARPRGRRAGRLRCPRAQAPSSRASPAGCGQPGATQPGAEGAYSAPASGRVTWNSFRSSFDARSLARHAACTSSRRVASPAAARLSCGCSCCSCSFARTRARVELTVARGRKRSSALYLPAVLS